MNTKFHIVTFGCQMNKLDSELLSAALRRRGFQAVDDPQDAGIVLYNTCSVREQAENRVLSHLGAWRPRARKDPDFIVGVIGCMAQRLGKQIATRFGHVRLVCGTRRFLDIPDYLEQIAATGKCVVALEEGPVSFERVPELRPEPHHAYVSIMRGCDNFCAYCIVPYVRGRETNRPPEEIEREVHALCEDGVVEVTLLGQSVSSYGKRLPDGISLATLLRRVSPVPGLRRLRFITSHPRDMSEDILRAVGELGNVCEHIHMPAQSGSDAVLARMGRRYTRDHYLHLVERGRELIDGAQFSGDFIVGFPGETDEDFELTLDLVERVRYQQSYIFRYSPREGTRAAKWADDVPDEVKRERQQRLLAAQERIDTERRGALLGASVEVLSNGRNRGDQSMGEWVGRTRRNDIVIFHGPPAPAGTVCDVEVLDSTTLTLFGRRVSG